MTEREKIIKIIAPYVAAYGEDEAIADAFIAAGIGDVKEAKKEAEYWENEAKTARADIDDAVKEITKRIFCELRNAIDEWASKAVTTNKFDGASVYNPHNTAWRWKNERNFI